MNILFIFFCLAAALVLVLVVSFISTGNRLARQLVKIEEADSGIDVALTKRYDTLTKLFDTAKSYLKQEQELVLQAIRLRQHMPIEEKQAAEQQLNEAAHQIRLVAEAYPALGAQALFVELQRAAADAEEHLQAARRLYNANVSALNQQVVSFPTSVVAGMKGIQKQPMFAVEAAKRADVNLQL